MNLLPHEYPKITLMIKSMALLISLFYISINVYTFLTDDFDFFLTNLKFTSAGVVVYFGTVFILLKGHKSKAAKNQNYVRMIPKQMGAANALIQESVRRNRVLEKETKREMRGDIGGKIKTQ